jgi:hypothetical protein
MVVGSGKYNSGKNAGTQNPAGLLPGRDAPLGQDTTGDAPIACKVESAASDGGVLR